MDADDFVQPHRIEFAEDAGERGVIHGAFDRAFLLGLKFDVSALPEAGGIAEIEPMRMLQARRFGTPRRAALWS